MGDVTHRRYRCPDCDTEVWIGKEATESVVEYRGLVCPCTAAGSDMKAIHGEGGEVRL